MEEKIKAHTHRVESGEEFSYCQDCPGCNKEATFKCHDRRNRTFRLIMEGFVKIYRSYILRLKCPNCGRRFTDWPPFCLASQAIRPPDDRPEVRRFSG